MKQEKIAISIDPLLLKEVEKTIDGTHVRNRSQAIELLVRKALGGKVATAIILAGGRRGEVKAMRLYNGKPVLHRLIEWMSLYGITMFIIAVDKNEKRIRRYFGDGSHFGVRIFYLLEPVPTGTAGAVHSCRSLVHSDFIVANCDSIFSLDIPMMVAYHRRNGKLVTMAVKEHITTSKYGTVEMEGDTVKGFYEKSASAPSRIINTGLYVMSRESFRYIPSKGMLERDVFPALAKAGKLGGFVFTSEWKDLEMQME